MFAYCNNNPIILHDSCGAMPSNSRMFAYACIYSDGGSSYEPYPLTKAEEYMLAAGLEFGVDPVMIATVIAVEQQNNVNFFDLADGPLGRLGVDTSVGYGQVKLSTAKMLEDLGLIERSANRWDRVNRLKDKQTNIRYVAAYLAYLRDIWIAHDPDFEDHPDIWWTVYNIGSTQAHANPQPGALSEEANRLYGCYEIIFGPYI